MTKSRARQRRAQRRRGRAEAAHQAAMRSGPKLPAMVEHYIEVDATQSLMERSPTAARLGVMFGALMFVAVIVGWLLALLGA